MLVGICLATVTSPAVAGTVYRWTDTLGHTHYSDTPPASPIVTTIEMQADGPRAGTGLRPGERATLHAIEQRRQSRQRTAEKARHSQRLERATRRQACDTRRKQLRRGRQQVDSKAIARYLREHCW